MQTTEELDPYIVLGLSPGAPAHEVKAQFRRLAKQFHPDLNPGSEWHQEQFRRIHTAYEMIDCLHRSETLIHPHGAITSSPETFSKPSSEAAWVHVGEASYSPDPPFVSETASAYRRRRSEWRIGRTLQPGLITGGLAAVAMFLIVFVMAEPHSRGIYSASRIALNTPLPLAMPNLLPPGAILVGTTELASSDPASSTAYPNTSLASAPQTGADNVSAPASHLPSDTASAQFSVDTKYMRIDPTYTAIDPKYTTVDIQAPSNTQEIGVDPKNTGIDPQLIRP